MKSHFILVNIEEMSSRISHPTTDCQGLILALHSDAKHSPCMTSPGKGGMAGNIFQEVVYGRTESMTASLES